MGTETGIGQWARADAEWLKHDVLRRREFQKVTQNLPAMFGQDAFKMKLHPVDRVFLVADAHDFAFVGFGGHFQKRLNEVILVEPSRSQADFCMDCNFGRTLVDSAHGYC